MNAVLIPSSIIPYCILQAIHVEKDNRQLNNFSVILPHGCVLTEKNKSILTKHPTNANKIANFWTLKISHLVLEELQLLDHSSMINAIVMLLPYMKKTANLTVESFDDFREQWYVIISITSTSNHYVNTICIKLNHTLVSSELVNI